MGPWTPVDITSCAHHFFKDDLNIRRSIKKKDEMEKTYLGTNSRKQFQNIQRIMHECKNNFQKNLSFPENKKRDMGLHTAHLISFLGATTNPIWGAARRICTFVSISFTFYTKQIYKNH